MILAHLSAENNRPELALEAARKALGWGWGRTTWSWWRRRGVRQQGGLRYKRGFRKAVFRLCGERSRGAASGLLPQAGF